LVQAREGAFEIRYCWWEWVERMDLRNKHKGKPSVSNDQLDEGGEDVMIC
jgi:hypothetical protein